MFKKKKGKGKKNKSLEEEILHLENDRNINNSPELIEKLDRLKQNLEEIRKEYIKGLFVRTKVKWIEEGGKPTKYFLSLEKRNYINKTVTKLIQDNDKIITEQSEILREIEKFYKNLYACRDDTLTDVDLESILDMEDVKILDQETKNQLEGAITIDEALTAVKNMKNDKSPGSDGFTAEFYKFFWKDIGHFLIRSINLGFQKGELSTTQKQGIISILPKGDKPREFLKNWRPISLLNVSYKIVSACIANRIKKVLDFLIHNNQKGFLKNRFIGENTRIIYDVLQNTQERNIPGILLLIDFEKAFDSISWKFMYKTLKIFNFGPELIQ